MSQAKVDRYKAEKKNRKKEIQKTKRQKRLTRLVAAVIIIAIAAWIAYSGISFYQEQQPVKEISVDLSHINDYLGGL